MNRLLITLSETELIISEEGKRLHGFGIVSDDEPFTDWSHRYALALDSFGDASEFTTLGQEMYAWLGGAQWLSPLLEQAVPPLIVDFKIKRRNVTPEQRAFLEAPWELLADEEGPLALDARVLYCPVRRIGDAAEPISPSSYRLNTVFMAASPRQGGPELDYEWEESQILRLHEAAALHMDLFVEESGNLIQLVQTVQQVKPVDVVHLSCHGNFHPATGAPFLALETEVGDLETISAEQLAEAYDTNQPALLFLSACKTSGQPEVPGTAQDSLTSDLIQRGFRAVLGWSGSVKDRAATIFASELYRTLSLSGSLERAVAQARLSLRPDAQEGRPDHRPDWHLARLYLGPTGGGVLTTSEQQRALRDVEEGTKAFLDETEKKVPVANRREFVGRRREIQDCLRVLGQRQKAGVLIHAIGHQGKSSLAARIANRLHQHRTVLIYGKTGEEHHYQPHHVLEKLKVVDNEAEPHISQLQNEVAQGNSTFHTALKKLLEERFSGISGQPRILLVVDDLEKVLETAPDSRQHQVKRPYRSSLAGIITAFAQARTQSCLILTSRHAFQLTDTHGKYLSEHLYPLPLPSFQEQQAYKQYRAKFVAKGDDDQRTLPDLKRVVKACHGNPGLQDLIIRLHEENKMAYDQALNSLEELEEQQSTENSPEQLSEFLADLAVEHLLALLLPGEQHLVRIARHFELPMPVGVWDALAKDLGLNSDYATHLLGLGVLERFEDLADPGQEAYWFNRLVGLRVPASSKLPKEFCQTIYHALQAHWTLEKTKHLSWVVDAEVTRWGLSAEESSVGAYAARAVRGQENAGDAIAAYALGSEVIDFLSKGPEEIPPALFRATALAAQLLGHMEEALRWFTAAQSGFELAEDQSAQAVTMGDIARIKVRKGSVDEALALHEIEIGIYEELGDKRSKAVTMGDIARIKVSKGSVDEALALHESRLSMFEELEDIRSKSATLWDMAQLDLAHQDLEAALPKLLESFQIAAQLGDANGTAIVGETLGMILWQGGMQEEARHILERAMAAYTLLGQHESAAKIRQFLEGEERD